MKIQQFMRCCNTGETKTDGTGDGEIIVVYKVVLLLLQTLDSVIAVNCD